MGKTILNMVGLFYYYVVCRKQSDTAKTNVTEIIPTPNFVSNAKKKKRKKQLQSDNAKHWPCLHIHNNTQFCLQHHKRINTYSL